METIKLHWNSVISTPNARYCTGDISNMYLMSDLIDSEYVKFKVDLIPPRIIQYYNIQHLIHEGYIYARINKAWYGLKNAGRIAHDDLVQHLQKNTDLYKHKRQMDYSHTSYVTSHSLWWLTTLG